MKSIDATRILLTRKRTTNKLRKQCNAARATVMRSDTPIYAEHDKETGTTDYYSSKASEVTDQERISAKLRPAKLAQLIKWIRRSVLRRAQCLRLLDKAQTEVIKNALLAKAAQYEKLSVACDAEIRRRRTKVFNRAA